MHDSPENAFERLLRDSRGAAMTEYIITVGVISLVLAVGFVARGDMLLFDYVNARDLLLVPAL